MRDERTKTPPRADFADMEEMLSRVTKRAAELIFDAQVDAERLRDPAPAIVAQLGQSVASGMPSD
jgi:hypothetical protein